MASSEKNLSQFNSVSGDVSRFRIGIVVSEWNEEVTESLYAGAFKTLTEMGLGRDHITRMDVPGSFELSLASQWMAEQTDIDAVIALGCVIQGETRHFEFICHAVAEGITQVGLKTGKPVVFGVLTTDTLKQALDRSGGRHGNKGDEAAATAVKMLLAKP